MLPFLDTTFFRKIASDTTAEKWNQFFDECKENEPALLDEGYDPICTWFTFLEYIGKGREIQKVRQRIANRTAKTDDAIRNHLVHGDKIGPVHKVLDDLANAIKEPIRSISQFERRHLIEAVDKQLELSSKNATNELIGTTLMRYRAHIESHLDFSQERI